MRTYEECVAEAAQIVARACAEADDRAHAYGAGPVSPHGPEHRTDRLQLYSVAQVAALLGTSRDYVYDRISAGELPVVELGTGRAKQRVRAEHLQAFIEARTRR